MHPASGEMRATVFSSYWLPRRQRITREAQIFNDASTDQVLLDDALGIFRSDLAIPRTLWIHDTDGSTCADPEALALRSIKRTVPPRNVQLLHPSLQVQPRPFTVLEIGAIRAK